MKRFVALLFGVCVCSVVLCNAASITKREERLKKVYVDPQSVMVTEEGIFVFDRGQMVPVESVGKDDEGVYVKEIRYMGNCGKCGRRYDFDRFNTCPSCGYAN